ncbi:extracellular solute-binding protein [Kribbella deserti]|uniref:Extracellular solute-binding protein n=1 Tax=Kribbella deserti TaxID=1926257 RepID=A0ABV6QHB3_9ACTN
MTGTTAGGPTSRRTFLAFLGAGAALAAGGGALAGCSSKPASSGKGQAETVDKLAGLLPAYMAFGSVKPDLPGVNGSSPGFTKYPTSLVRAVPEKAVTSGKEVTAMTPLWAPLPPGLGNNSYYDANNERIGAPVRFNIVNGMDYGTKLGTVLAAGNVPDMICIPGWEIAKLSRFDQAVDKLFEDLTPYLAGDKVSKYPMLANLPTNAWAFSVWNSQLKAIPFPSVGIAWILYYRKDLLDKAGVTPPQNADDFMKLGKQLTNARANQWAFGGVNDELARAYGAPGKWRKESDGKLVHKYETPEFEESVALTAKLYKAGYVHPAVVGNKDADQKPLFEGGQILIRQDGTGTWAETLQRQQGNRSFNMQAVKPFAHDGGTPIVWAGDPAGIFTFIKKGVGEQRIAELLGVANYSSAPFGTEEFELSNNGVEGKHYTRAASGAPQLTALGNKEVAATYTFLGGRPSAITQGQHEGYVEAMHAFEVECANHREKNLFEGIRVQEPSKMAALHTPFDDRLQDIYRGRRPVSDLKAAVKEWQNNGGNEGRDFYAKVLSDNGR